MSKEFPGICFIACCENTYGKMVYRGLEFFPRASGDGITPLYRKWVEKTLEKM